MADEDIEERPWRKTVRWTDTEQVLKGLKEEIENYEPLGDLLAGPVSFPYVNILLFAGVGSGKSSIYNTWNSVFRGKIFNAARSGHAEHSLTRKVSKYNIMSASSSAPTPLKFKVCDTQGLEPDHLMSNDNMRYLLEGNIPDKFPLDPSAILAQDTPGFIKSPKLEDRIHCVVIVQDATMVDVDTGPEVKRNIKEMQAEMNKLDVPQVVILTKIDSVSSDVECDVSKTFNSVKIKKCVAKASELLGVPKNCIFPMKNYESETENDPYVDIVALLSLKGVLNQCDGYLFNNYEKINQEYNA